MSVINSLALILLPILFLAYRLASTAYLSQQDFNSLDLPI